MSATYISACIKFASLPKANRVNAMPPRIVVSVLAVALVGQAAAGVVLLNNAGFVSAADAHLGSQSAQRESLAIPSSYDLVAQRGSSLARNTATYGVESGQTVFSHDLFMQRSGLQWNLSSNASVALFEFRFMVEVDTSYALSGWLAIDDAGSAGRSQLQSTLRNLTTNSSVYSSTQSSAITLDESFVLGDLGGDEFSSSSGSLTGTLTAGHLYRWEFMTFTAASPDPDQGATATGNVTLRLGNRALAEPPASPNNSVPIPGTLPLVAAALLALPVCRRRTRRHIA